jgi:hypothetical protein
MPRVGFELTIPVFERAKKFHALDRAATVIGTLGTTERNSVQFGLHRIRKNLLGDYIHLICKVKHG